MASLVAIRLAQQERTEQAASAAEAATGAFAAADELVADAPARAHWACRAGCAACCHLLVLVKPAEADAIALRLRAEPRTEERPLRLERLRANAHAAEGLAPGDYRRRRLACAFLTPDQRCAIYAVRPLKCRVHASTDAAACGDLHGPIPLDGWMVRVGQAVQNGLSGAPVLELHRAVLDRLGT